MGFTITSGGTGLIGGLFIGAVIIAGVIAVVMLLTGAKQAHDEIVEEDHDAAEARGEERP